MKSIILAIFVMLSVSLSAQTSNLQYQAHVPAGTSTDSKFSVYIADGTFDENSHLNSNALWYRENVDVQIQNGIVNYLLEAISDTIFINNYTKQLFVYAYVNGVSLGKLQIHTVPYSLMSTYSLQSATSTRSERATRADRSKLADTATFSLNARNSVTSVYSDTSQVSLYSNTSGFSDTSRAAGKAVLSDLATYASTAAHSVKSDTARFSINGAHANYSDTSLFASDADHADFSSLSAFATNAARSVTSDTARFLVDSTITSRNVQRGAINLFAIEGGETAQIGTYATRGTNGISWESNPHHKTSSIAIYTSAPPSIPADRRWIVSRVAVDYNIPTVSNPNVGQLISIYNGSTANFVTIRNVIWGIDTGLDYTISPNQSRTLWYSGANWVVVE